MYGQMMGRMPPIGGMRPMGQMSRPTTNAAYGWNNQVIDDNKSSGLSLGPQPFRTTKSFY